MKRKIIETFEVRPSTITGLLNTLSKLNDKYGHLELYFELNEYDTIINQVQVWEFEGTEKRWITIAN